MEGLVSIGGGGQLILLFRRSRDGGQTFTRQRELWRGARQPTGGYAGTSIAAPKPFTTKKLHV
jgi:hypothetical protein